MPVARSIKRVHDCNVASRHTSSTEHTYTTSAQRVRFFQYSFPTDRLHFCLKSNNPRQWTPSGKPEGVKYETTSIRSLSARTSGNLTGCPNMINDGNDNDSTGDGETPATFTVTYDANNADSGSAPSDDVQTLQAKIRRRTPLTGDETRRIVNVFKRHPLETVG
jgi:hypothetical protein